MNQIETFRKLLDKFKFTNAIPTNVQIYVSGNQKRALINSLKNIKASSLFYSFVLTIFFALRKKGYAMSLPICKAIAWITLISTASFTSGGIAYIAASSIKEETMIEQPVVTEKHTEIKQSRQIQKYRLGVSRFMSRNDDTLLSEKVTAIIAEELSAKLGNDYVLMINNERNSKKVNLMLMGAVGKLGNELIISTKIIDVESSRVLFAENTEVNGENDIQSKAKHVSENIARFIREQYSN